MIGQSGLSWVAKNATIMLSIGVFIGIAFQPLARLLAPWLEILIIFNLSLSMIRIAPETLTKYINRPFLIASIFVFSMGVAPLILYFFTTTTGLEGPLGAGIVFHALTTPIMSAPALCILFGLDAALALIVTVMSYALVPFTLPPLALWLLGIELDVTVVELTWRLGRIVGTSFLIAFIVRKTFNQNFLNSQSSHMDGIMVLGMVGVAVSIMSGLPNFIADKPEFALTVLIVTYAINVVLQVLSTALFWKLGRRQAITVALITGNTNVALVLAAVSESASYELLVYFVLGQFPIYTLPLIAVPIYKKVLERG